MSSKYNVEPPPTAKVILHTTAGDLTLELFGRQTPLTTRNFLQHCLDGYYDGTIFHRLVSGFVLQGGDPTGIGSGGESIYADVNGEKVAAPGQGGVFKDEFHSRLRFDRRGLLGMANEGKDGNGSQFFFTLGATPELQNKNTMFGRVVGDTVFNLVKMGEADVTEGSERPLYPEKIVGAEVLINPFEDMAKRDIKTKRAAVEERKKEVKPKRKVGKAMLSFADEEDFAPLAKKPKLGSAGKADPKELNDTRLQGASKEKKAKLESRREQPSSSKPQSSKREESESPSESEDEEEDESARRTKVLSETERQIAELKASMRRNGAATSAPKEEKKSAFESIMPENAIRGRQKSSKKSTDKDTSALSLYNQFKAELDTALSDQETADEDLDPKANPTGDANTAKPKSAADDEDANLCDLHFIPNCMSCAKWKDEVENEDEDDDDDWFNRKLTFAKDRLGKNLEWKKKNEEISVIDPREKERELGIKPPKAGYSRDRKSEWVGRG